MVASVEIKFDKAALRRVQKMLRDIPQAMPRVMSRAINKTATGAKTNIARQIAGEVKIKVSVIKKSISLKRASRQLWRAVLSVWSKRVPLINFAARQTKKGVTYKISKTGSRQTIESAFITTLPSGHKGVFKRKGKSRTPIVELRGPSVGEVFRAAPKLIRRVTKQAYQKLERNIDAQVKLALSQWKAAR